MNQRDVPDLAALLDAGKFDPGCAETSYTLTARWYYDPLIHELERQRIFAANWCYLCHAGDLAAPGDAWRDRVAGCEVLIRRDADGELSANLVDSGRPAAIELYGGFVFVNLDPGAAPLRSRAGRLLDDIYRCCPRLDELRRVRRVEREIAANWKTVIDNNHECYHCAANHPGLMKLVDYATQAEWRDDGITFTHAVKRRDIDNPAYRLDADRVEQDSLFGYVWPNLVPLFFPGSPSALLFQVIPSGPESCVARHDFYFLDDELSDQERGFVDYIDRVLVPEDVALCESVQKGLHSRGYQQGHLIVDRDHPEFSEHHVHFFQQFVYQALKESGHDRQ